MSKLTPNQYIQSKGWNAVDRGNGELWLNCPACGEGEKDGSFSIHETTGTWNCKRGSCNGIGPNNQTSGTLFQLMSGLGDISHGYHPPKQNMYEKVKHTKTAKTFAHPKPIIRDDSVAAEAAEYIRSRGLDIETAKLFGVTPTSVDGVPAIAFPYFRNGNHVHTKYRLRDGDKAPWKNFTADSGCKRCLYGADLIPQASDELIITEGEFDAIAVRQLGLPAVSLPDGIDSIDQWLNEEFDWLQRFKTIYLLVDMDVPQDKINTLSMRLGKERVKRPQMPFKDANECLAMGWDVNDLQMALNEAVDMKPVNLKQSMDLCDEFARKKFSPEGSKDNFGAPWRIPGLSEYLKGKVLGRMTMWPGFNFAGKTTAMLQEMGDDCSAGVKCLFFCLEISAMEAMEWILQQQLMKPMDQINIREFRDALTPESGFLDNLWWVEPEEKLSINDICECARYAVLRYGVEQIYIDNLTCIPIAKDDYNGQANFASLCKFKIARALNVHVHIVAHTRKAQNVRSVSADRNDIAGAKELSDLADNVLIVRRNEEEDEEKSKGQPTTYIRVDKNRFGGTQGTIDLTFNKHTGRFDKYLGVKKRNKKPGIYREYQSDY